MHKLLWLWYEEAAKCGYIEAFNNFGVLYKEGHGVGQDFERAFICFERASNGSLSIGNYNLGLMYDQGLCAEKRLMVGMKKQKLLFKVYKIIKLFFKGFLCLQV